jgi:N,N'-diacetyllegionaminate synthase
VSVYIIAEAGVNHNGNLQLAKTMVDRAKEAGADCIKFQTFVTNNLVSKFANKAEYQKKTTGSSESQYDMLAKLELSFAEFRVLSQYCTSKEIEFLSTAFDLESLDFLKTLEMARWKVPSGDITNLPYLMRIALLHQPVILSTGMSTMEEIRKAVHILKNNGSGDITVLHCTTEYPAPYEDVHLKAMLEIARELELPVGYSDHTRGIEIPIAAVAMGAKIIEKHFTLDKSMEGPDHQSSLEPDEFKAMADAIRHVETALGADEKKPSPSEIKNIAVARKSIVAKCFIKKGETLTEENLAVKRPGNGVTPMRWYDIIGSKAIRDFLEDELIEI